MNEININIEGYNVNGICVGCLNYNRKMYYRDHVKECFRVLGNIDVPDGLTIQVCWECLAAVNAATRFQQQIQKSYDVLMKYSRQHTFLNSPSDLTKHATERLTISVNRTLDYCKEEDGELDEAGADYNMEYEGVKEYVSELDLKNESDHNTTADFPDPVKSSASSDEDVTIYEIKREKRRKARTKKGKVKRGKVKVKEGKVKVKEESKEKGRQKDWKLKNLPEDAVELFTMTEEQMWETRKADVVHKEFVKMRHKCESCIIGFNTARLKDDHMTGKHTPKSKHQCDVCQAYVTNKDSFAAHRSLHLKGYRCKECQYITTMKKLMARHVTEHGAKWAKFPCPLCDKVFITKSRLSYHKNVCTQEKPQCDCCGKVFANKVSLRYHLKVLSGEKPDSKPKEKLNLTCKGCNKVFHSKKSYRAHAHECEYCGKKFPTKWCMTDHIDWDHLKKIKYQCFLCLKAFKTAKIMVAHVNNIHHGKKEKEDGQQHLCDICGKSYKTDKRLKGHVWAMHTHRSVAKSFKCRLCPATFTWQTSIYKHMKCMHQNTKKQSSLQPVPLKDEPYGTELTQRIPYYDQNITPVPANQQNNVNSTILGV